MIVRRVAPRMGMLRLGLEIARKALDAETMTLIDGVDIPGTGVMKEGHNLGAIEIVLADDPLLQPEPAKDQPALLGLVAVFSRSS